MAEIITEASDVYLVLRFRKTKKVYKTKRGKKNGKTVTVHLRSKTGQLLYEMITKTAYLESEENGERWDDRAGEYRSRRKWSDTKNVLLAHRFESVKEALKYSKITGCAKQLLKWGYKMEVMEVTSTITRTARRVHPLDAISALGEIGRSALTEEVA